MREKKLSQFVNEKSVCRKSVFCMQKSCIRGQTRRFTETEAKRRQIERVSKENREKSPQKNSEPRTVECDFSNFCQSTNQSIMSVETFLSLGKV